MDAACLSDEQLAAWSEGTAPAADLAAMNAHLAACATCRQVLSELIRTEGQRPVARTLGRYQLQEELGAGGMGRVYAAWDPVLARKVAVKLLDGAPDEPGDRARRFEHERRILAKLEHPHIGRLFDAGETADGRPFLVMELIDGQPLDAYCDSRRLAARQRLELMLPVLEAVAHVHQRQVVHRDLKPGNILVTPQGVPKLVDFGLARVLQAPSGLTVAGMAPMTPAYAAPEQVRRGPVSPASDVYALGVVLYELLTGVSPYPGAGGSLEGLLRAVESEEAPRASEAVARSSEAALAARATTREALRRELESGLDAILATALRKEASRRQASVEVLALELRGWLAGLATPMVHDTVLRPSQDGSLRQALADRYEVVRLLGQGGMATVYLAREPARDRYLAVKVMRPELAGTPSEERFLREVATLRRLDHPNILGLFDDGEAAGWRYFTMPLVTGESLRDRLRREGQLRLDEVQRLATQLGAALDHAHQRGVVHRDLKPENVLLSGPRALLADFGVARLLEPAAPPADAATLPGATAAGQVVGTPAYMSPEQVTGAPGLDGRSDVYALGVLVYELLVGEPPFTGATAVELMARHLADAPQPARQRLPDVPESMDQAVLKALAKDPVDRFPTAGEFAAALAGQALGAAARTPRASIVQLVAVLDFEDLSGDAELGWLGTGIAESVAGELGRLKGVRVVSRDKVARAAPQALGIADEEAALLVGKALGARWVVWGTYQRAGKAVRILQRSADVAAGRATAPLKTDGPLEELFSLQDRVVDAVVTALAIDAGHLTLSRVEARDGAALSAYEHSIRGLQHFRRFGPKGFAEAWRHYEQALALDPRHARAHAGMGAICCFRYIGNGKREELDLALRLLSQASALDPGLGEAHLWRGYALLRLHRYDEAIAALEQATVLDPHNDFAHYMLGAGRQLRGLDDHRWEDFARAIPSFLRSIELQPASIPPYFGMGVIYLLQGDYPHAAGVLEKAVEIEQRGQVGTVRLPGAATLLASLERRRGEDAAAAARLQEALPRYEADDHLYAAAFTALTRCELGLLADRAGHLEQALGHYLAAAAVCEAHAERLGVGQMLVRARLGMAGCYARLGQEGPRREAAASALELFARHEGPPFDTVWGAADATAQADLARYHVLAGEDALAVQALRTAVDWGWGDLPDFERDPVLADFRQRPEVQALVALVRSREPLPGYPPSLVGGTR